MVGRRSPARRPPRGPATDRVFRFAGLPRGGALQATRRRQSRRPRIPAGDDVPATDAAAAAVRARVM